MDAFFSSENPQDLQTPHAESDPTADFLAREQAALGDDHAFVTGSGSSGSATAAPTISTSSARNTTVADDDFETVEHSPSAPLSAGSNATATTPAAANDQQYDSFRSDFPPVEEIGQNPKASSVRTSASSIQNTREPEVESEAVREWRKKHTEAISERDRKSAAKQKEQIEQAKQAIDRFYEEYNEKKQKSFNKNRENETAQAAENASGTVWEKVGREVDAAAATISKNAKGPSRDRMRQVLSELRKEPDSPGNKAK